MQAQKETPESLHELQQVEANACKHRIELVASASGKHVPVHAVIALDVSDDRFYRTSPLPPSQQGAGPFPAKPVDHLNVDVARVVVSAIAEVAVGVFGLGAADRLGLFQDFCERVAVVWIAGNRHRPEHPVCPRCRHEACLHAELVARVDLALGDALDLRLVERVDLVLAGRVPVLRQQPARTRDVFLQRDDQPELARVARYDRLAFGEVDDVSEVLLERPDRILRAVELLRLHVSGMLAQHRLPLAHVRALEPDPQLLPDGDDAFARTVERTGVGRESDVLLLYGRIDVDLLEVAPLRDLAPHGGRDGFLQHLRDAGLSDPRTPAAHNRLVGGRLVLEERAPAERLPVRVLNPPVEDLLVAQPVHGAQHHEADHHPHRDRRTTIVLAIDRLEHFFETPPVDRIPQQDQLVLRMDDIPQQDLEEVRLNGGGGVTFRHHFWGATFEIYLVLRPIL